MLLGVLDVRRKAKRFISASNLNELLPTSVKLGRIYIIVILNI